MSASNCHRRGNIALPAAIAVAWIELSDASLSLSVFYDCVTVCSARAPKRKWLELSTPKSV